jgi:hypothetical protein
MLSLLNASLPAVGCKADRLTTPPKLKKPEIGIGANPK